MATTLEVERQLSNAGYMPQGVDFSPRFTAPADIEGIVRGAAGKYGLNPDDAVAVARLESGLNPRAQNPNSSAGGLFQFINSTWGQYGGGDKYDPARNADAGARYLRDVRDTLTRGLGRAPTVGELYLGHQQGPAGALRILQNPDGLARDAVGPDAVVLNGGTIDMTNRDFAMRWDRRASRAAGQTPGILDTIGAAARQNIGIAGLLGYGMPFHRGTDDPTFNAITTADADPALRPYLSQFIDVRNREEYDRTAERVRRASDDKETLAAAGPFGMAASVAAGILDPINLIPVGGGAWKLFKAGRYVEGALGGIIAGGGGAALQELMLQQADPTRTAEDAGLNIVSGALGGAGLGVGSVAASGNASRLARAGILGAGGAAGGAAAGLGEALYSGQDIGGALATIGTSAVIGGLLGGSVGALARPGRTARDSLHDLARTVDIETDTGNGAIYSDVRRQLLAAGRPEAEADAGGKLWQSHVDAISRATGIPQADVYRSIGLDVRTGDVPEGALAQSTSDLTETSQVTPEHGAKSFAEYADKMGLKPGTKEYDDAYISWIDKANEEKINKGNERRIAENKVAIDKRNAWKRNLINWFNGAKDGDFIEGDLDGEKWIVSERILTRGGKQVRIKSLGIASNNGLIRNIITETDGKIVSGPRDDLTVDSDGHMPMEHDIDQTGVMLGKGLEDGTFRATRGDNSSGNVVPSDMGGRPDGAEFVGRVFGRDAAAEMGGEVLFQSVGRDLPMDEASRLERAREMGFTIDAYHGSGADFAAFSSDAEKATGGGLNNHGFFFSSDPKVASRYADSFGGGNGKVYPVLLKAEKPLTLTPIQFEVLQKAEGALRRGESLSETKQISLEVHLEDATGVRPPDGVKSPVEWVRSLGYDAIEKRPAAGSIADHEIMVFSPDQVRSRFARFDPERTGSADLLAQDIRGAVDFRDGMARITLSAKADASTFLHESSHVFLNTLDRLAEQSPELAADMKTVREWIGNDGGAITRDQHEQWARGFEAHLRDGKAPNSALSEVFERFRDWLTAIYRSLTDLNVELSDDVRGVMDRLIGVDQEPTTGRGGSLSAAAIPAATADDLRIARGGEVLARIQSHIPIARGPDLILGTSPVRAARWAMRKLMRPVLATVGDMAGRAEVVTENVESAMQQWHGGEVTAKHQANAIYTEYAKAAAKTGEPVLKAQDIIDAASMAGRRGDSGAKLALGPEAQKAAAATAKAYREAVFDPLLKQALEHGLLTKAQVEKARRFADSYIPRVWNINKILEKRTQFTNEVVMPQVVRDWEESRAKLARMRQVTRFADEQLRQIEAAGIEHGGADAAALIADGADRSPAQIMRENIKQIKAALDDPAAQWADGDEDRARFLLAKSRTPAIAQGGIEGIRKGGPALTDVEAQELQDMLYRTHGLRPADPTDIGVRATRAVQAMRTRVAELERAATTARETKPLASMTPEQATEAGRMMAEQADKLANDAAAVKALADQHETALKKSLRERARAYRALDADDAIGRLDEEDLPGVASDIVDALVGHTNNRVQYEGLKVTARGALKEKTFNVRDEKVDGGGGDENWLENDIELLASRYTRTLAPDVELKRLTGDVNAEPLRQQIIQEYIDRSNAMEDGPKKRKLDARLNRDLEAFDGVVSRMRGTYGVPKDTGEVWGLRAARLLKAFNFVRLMGNGPISQIGDVGRIVFRSGMSRFLGDAVMPMISNWDAVRLTKRELQQADIATELVRSSMALRGAEMFDEYSNTTKIEQLANKAAAGASKLYGLDHWNQGNKTIAGMIAQSSLVDGVRKLAAGADMKPMEIADLSRVGIGAREAEFLMPFLDEFGRDVRGVTIPNTADWSGDGAADAARLWRGAMRQIADDMVINPGQDRSLFLSKPFRSLLFQLETFNLVSTQRTLIAGFQRRDAGVLIGAGVMVGLGMLSYWLKAKIASWVFGSTTTWKMPDSPGDWILQGVNQSGLLGVISSIDQRLLAATRGTVGSEALVGSPTRSRFAAADFASLFGPSASAGQVAFTSLQNAAAGDWNWKDTHRLRSLAPMQNYFIVRGLYDQGEKWLNDQLGVRRPVQR